MIGLAGQGCFVPAFQTDEGVKYSLKTVIMQKKICFPVKKIAAVVVFSVMAARRLPVPHAANGAGFSMPKKNRFSFFFCDILRGEQNLMNSRRIE